MKSLSKTTAIALGIALLTACAGPERPQVTPQELAAFNLKIKEADSHFQTYSYLGLKSAFRILKDLLDFPAFQRRSGEKFVQTALLLSLREKELGIFNPATLGAASALISCQPALEGFARYVDIVDRIPVEAKGITGEGDEDDESIDDYFEWVKHSVPPLNAHLKEKAESNAFFAYLYICFNAAYSYKFEEKEDFSRFRSLYPDSPLIRYKLAVHPNLDHKNLSALLDSDPQFHEAHIFLGDIELSQGKVLSAERLYHLAYPHIPESTSLVISLSKVYFHMEEFDLCLDYNERALQLAPGYRDAILGKALCLGYLGRHDEAISELQSILELGKYYIGEANYWLAWNLHELERIAEAYAQIEKAKNYLIGHYEVMSLAGILAYKQGLQEQAEKDLLEALRLNAFDCEAAYYMGKVHADRENWKESGEFFERSASCHQRTEGGLQERIREIEDSSLAPARKDKLILKKKTQILQTRRSKATAFYNAAAGYYNAKDLEKALNMAEKAAQHPVVKEKAQVLIDSIKRDTL